MATAVANGVHAPPAVDTQDLEKSFGGWLSCVMRVKSYRTCDYVSGQLHKNLQVDKGPGTIKEEALRFMGESYSVKEKALNSLSELTMAAGGALVPLEYAYGLMRDVAEDSIFWPRAFVQPMNARTLLMPLPDPTGSIGIAGVPNMFGGMQMQFRQTQAPGIAETEPAFRQVELCANECDGYLLASNQLVQDYPGLDAFIRSFGTRAIAWCTDQEFFTGGPLTAGPQGILESIAPNGGTLKVARQTSGSVTLTDLSNMWQRLLPQSKKRAVWAISPGALQPIANTTGLGGLIYFIPGEDGAQGLIYGRPFYETEKLVDVNINGPNDGCIVLFDPSMYIIGHRGLFIDYSDQWPQAFLQNQSAFRVVWRGDGLPMLNKPITLANQSAVQVSPYVCLGDVSGL